MTATSRDPSIPDPPRGPRLRARDALVTVLLAFALLVLFEGDSFRASGEQMQPGVERDLVLAVGKPAGWVADQLPLRRADLFAWLSSEDDLGGGGFDKPVRGPAERGIAPVSPGSFDPADLGAKPKPPRRLGKVLVTGDSLAIPLDVELARKMAGDDGVRVLREPHIGTGVSKSGFVDWGKLSARQVRKHRPEAIVVFIGANEGFPLPAPGGKVECCGPVWAAEYANRVRRMMNTYRQRGGARVYWLNLPLPRDRGRQEAARAVNAALDVASVPFRSQVRVLDMEQTFTPDRRYRGSMQVDGRDRSVREPDGIHLNATGAELASREVLAAIRRDFRR